MAAEVENKSAVLLSDVLKNLIKSLLFPGAGSTRLDPEECLEATINGLWSTDLTWSEEAKELRRQAILSPGKSIFKRAKSDIHHLRIINKQDSRSQQEAQYVSRAIQGHACGLKTQHLSLGSVAEKQQGILNKLIVVQGRKNIKLQLLPTLSQFNRHKPWPDVDEDLAGYVELEELTLTGNFLTTIPPEHLPHTLKDFLRMLSQDLHDSIQLEILELCYNQLISLDSLDERTHVNLQHLGVSHNQISNLHLTPKHWPALVSLDLSFNLLSNIEETTAALSRLDSLRNTSLMGNPLSLVPCYRSFVVNSLPQLICLDDKDVTVIERGMARGVAQLCSEDFLHVANFEVKLTSIAGLLTLKEVADEECCITRFILVVSHSFLPSMSYRRKESDSDKTESLQAHLSTSHTNGSGGLSPDDLSVCLKETAYPSNTSSITPMTATYLVNDLQGLAKLLARGVEFSLCLRQLVYTQKLADSAELATSKAGKVLKTASKTSTSGRSSVVGRQPSRASSRKSNAALPPAGTAQGEKKGKKRSSVNNSLQLGAALPSPEEGWALEKHHDFFLGRFSVSLSSLLERSKLSMVQEHSKTSLPLKMLEREGLVEPEGGNSGEPATEAGLKLTEKSERLIEVDVEIHLQTITSEQQMTQ